MVHIGFCSISFNLFSGQWHMMVKQETAAGHRIYVIFNPFGGWTLNNHESEFLKILFMFWVHPYTCFHACKLMGKSFFKCSTNSSSSHTARKSSLHFVYERIPQHHARCHVLDGNDWKYNNCRRWTRSWIPSILTCCLVQLETWLLWEVGVISLPHERSLMWRLLEV